MKTMTKSDQCERARLTEGKFSNGTGAQQNQRFGRRRCQLQIDRDGLTFGRTPQTIRTPVCGLGTVTERNRKCLWQKDAVNLSSLTGWQLWLADRRTGGKHRSSDRPPLSATEWIVGNFYLGITSGLPVIRPQFGSECD